MLPTCEKYGMGVIPWSPLDGGWLTGRIRKDTGVDMTTGRARRLPERFDQALPGNQAKLDAVEELIKIAADAGCSLTHMALAFVVGHPAVTAAIIGPRTMDQLTDILAGADVTLEDDVLDRIDQIVPPGVNLNPSDAGFQPTVLSDAARRRPLARRPPREFQHNATFSDEVPGPRLPRGRQMRYRPGESSPLTGSICSSHKGRDMELGLHIADFTWTGGAPALGPALARHARNAEAAGITRITVMDHFWQIRGVGPAEHEMLEAYTTLGFLAAHTQTVRLHTLVTGVIYRQPALLAKAVTTLDVLSGGRAGLGVGAAWNEDESVGLGFGFPPVAERFERLEEALQICLQMWSGSEAPYDGQALPAGADAELAAEPGPPAPLPDDRRRRRAQDAAPGGPVRGRLQHRREPGRRAQARRAQAALRRRWPRLRPDREDHHAPHRPGHHEGRPRPPGRQKCRTSDSPPPTSTPAESPNPPPSST